MMYQTVTTTTEFALANYLVDDPDRVHCYVNHAQCTDTGPTILAGFVCWLVACFTSQQHASVSQGRIYSDNCTFCHTETEVTHQTFYLTQSQHIDTGPTSPSADPITPDAWQGNHWNVNFEVTGMTRRKRDSNTGPSAFGADALTTWPTRRCLAG